MKKLILIILLLFPFHAHALELNKTTEHPNGWSFLFSTRIKTKDHPKGENFPIELPFNKCAKNGPKGDCFETVHEARKAAWTKAKKAEGMMRKALGDDTAHTK